MPVSNSSSPNIGRQLSDSSNRVVQSSQKHNTVAAVLFTIHKRENLFFASIVISTPKRPGSHSAMLFFTNENPGIPAKDVGNEYTHHQINVVDILFSFSRNYAIKASEARNACHGAIFAMKHRMGSLPVKGVPSFAH
jgi:hypothetical protein